MNKMHFNQIICFGEVLWDMLPNGAEPGGAPLNVAIHLKRFGKSPWLVSRIGNDREGNELRQYLSKAGLNLQYLQYDTNLPTSKVIVHLDESGNATYEIIEPVAWDNVHYFDVLEKLAGEADLILFGTLASRNEVTRTTLLRMLEKTPATKLLDVNLRPPYDNRVLVELFLGKADIVKLNHEELLQIAAWNRQSGTVSDLARWFAIHYSCPVVCVTRGANGALLHWQGEIVEHPGFKVDAVDTVGAGDAFLAALISCLSEGASPETALEFASAAGALVASRNGAVPYITPKEIEKVKGK